MQQLTPMLLTFFWTNISSEAVLS